MDRKCDIKGCDRYVRQIIRVGGDLMFFCNGHHFDIQQRITKFRKKVQAIDPELLQTLANESKNDDELLDKIKALDGKKRMQ